MDSYQGNRTALLALVRRACQLSRSPSYQRRREIAAPAQRRIATLVFDWERKKMQNGCHFHGTLLFFTQSRRAISI